MLKFSRLLVLVNYFMQEKIVNPTDYEERKKTYDDLVDKTGLDYDEQNDIMMSMTTPFDSPHAHKGKYKALKSEDRPDFLIRMLKNPDWDTRVKKEIMADHIVENLVGTPELETNSIKIAEMIRTVLETDFEPIIKNPEKPDIEKDCVEDIQLRSVRRIYLADADSIPSLVKLVFEKFKDRPDILGGLLHFAKETKDQYKWQTLKKAIKENESEKNATSLIHTLDQNEGYRDKKVLEDVKDIEKALGIRGKNISLSDIEKALNELDDKKHAQWLRGQHAWYRLKDEYGV